MQREQLEHHTKLTLDFPLQAIQIALGEVVKQEIQKHFQQQDALKETELLTRKQAAKLLGISLPTLLEWTKSGTITGYRIASRIRYKKDELENSLSQIKTRR
jgi:excisionase family DNA binding protein